MISWLLQWMQKDHGGALLLTAVPAVGPKACMLPKGRSAWTGGPFDGVDNRRIEYAQLFGFAEVPLDFSLANLTWSLWPSSDFGG